MRYTLLLHYREPAEGELDEAQISEGMNAFHAYANALEEAGVLHAAEVLQSSAATTTVSRQNGTTQVQDGPFAETKEQLAGLFVLDVPDLDAALAWAEKCPAAQWGAVEIRPTAVHFRTGQWLPG